MRKTGLIPIATITVATSAITPLITSCGKKPINDGGIGGNYKDDGKYIHDEYQPLEYSEDFEQEEIIKAGFDKLAEDKNNFAYDYLLFSNYYLHEASTSEVFNISFKINNFDLSTKALDYQINYELSVSEGDSMGKILAHLTCQHIVLNIYPSGDGNFKKYKLGPHALRLNEGYIFDYLMSDYSGDGSITGNIYIQEDQSTHIEDKNCDYNKMTLPKIYSDYLYGQGEKWNCLKASLGVIDYYMYYLKNYF